MKYNEFMHINEDFIPVFDLENEEADQYWSLFIPNDKFRDILSSAIDSLNPTNQKNPIWLQGTYGTGKTHATSVIKHLLCDETLPDYDLEDNQENDSFYFKMNKDMFEQNIHDCIKDFCKLRTPHIDEVMGCEKIDYNSKNFNQDNFPLRLEWKENYKGKSLEIVGREKNILALEQELIRYIIINDIIIDIK